MKYNGFRYTRLLEGRGCYLYEQRVTQTRSFYEVFKHKVKAERFLHGKRLPANVRFPHYEAFGDWAWSYPTLEKAIKKFLSII